MAIRTLLPSGQVQEVGTPNSFVDALNKATENLRQSRLAKAQAGYSDAMAEQVRQNAIWFKEIAGLSKIEDKKASLKARLWGEEKYKNFNEKEMDSLVEEMWNTMNMFSGVAQ